jgi:hypothetical protein
LVGENSILTLKETQQELGKNLIDGLVITGWLLMIPVSAMMFFAPLGGIVFGPPIEVEGKLAYLATTYVSYPAFQLYVSIIALGSILVGIGLVGFYIRFENHGFLATGVASFIAGVLNVRCAVIPDWRLPVNAYTRESIDNIELFVIMTLLVTVVPMFLYCLSLLTAKGRTGTLRFIIPILILSGTAFGGLLLVLFQNLANPERFLGFEILRMFSIMSLTYIVALVSCLCDIRKIN